jgi:hypothetical protein
MTCAFIRKGGRAGRHTYSIALCLVTFLNKFKQ